MWHINEGLLLSSHGIQEGRQKSFRTMRQIELKCFNMVTYSLQCGHPCWFGEGTRAKGDGDLFEKQRGGANAEIMAGEAERVKIILFDV